MVFADITAAYYSAVRELAAAEVNAEDMASIGKHIPVAQEHKLCRHLKETPAMQAAHASEWLCNRSRAKLNYMNRVGQQSRTSNPLTKRGARPRPSFADITFGLLLKRILDFRQTLRSQQRDAFLFLDGERFFEPPPAVKAHGGAEGVNKAGMGDIVWADALV